MALPLVWMLSIHGVFLSGGRQGRVPNVLLLVQRQGGQGARVYPLCNKDVDEKKNQLTRRT